MKKHILAGISMVALAAALQPAAAADLPVAYRAPQNYVIFTWTGFYFGAHGGGGWGRKDATICAVRVRRRPRRPAGDQCRHQRRACRRPDRRQLPGRLLGLRCRGGRQLGGSHRQHRMRDRHRRGRGELPREGGRARHLCRPAGLRARSRPALRQGRHRLRQRQVRAQLDRRVPIQRDPLGLDGGRAASNIPSPTIGPPRSNTITSTSAPARCASRTPPASSSSIPTSASASTSPKSASTIASVGRRSASPTDADAITLTLPAARPSRARA